MSGVLEGMQEYMGGVRAYFERARAVRAFSERITPAQFGARDRRILAVGMRNVSPVPWKTVFGEATPVEKLAEYHLRLLEAETTEFFGGIRVISHPRALPGSTGIVQVRR